MRTGVINKIIQFLFILFIPVIFLLVSTRLITTQTYMMLSYNKYDRHEEIYFDYKYANQNVVDYLNGKQDSLEFPTYKGQDDILMTERGLAHMKDVKVLYDYAKIVLIALIFFVIIAGYYLYKTKTLRMSLKKVWIVPVVMIFILSLGMFIDFDLIFTKFHHLFFNNDLWLLDYYDPLLIMYPEDFFRNTAIFIFIGTLILSFGTSLLAYKIGEK